MNLSNTKQTVEIIKASIAVSKMSACFSSVNLKENPSLGMHKLLTLAQVFGERNIHLLALTYLCDYHLKTPSSTWLSFIRTQDCPKVADRTQMLKLELRLTMYRVLNKFTSYEAAYYRLELLELKYAHALKSSPIFLFVFQAFLVCLSFLSNTYSDFQQATRLENPDKNLTQKLRHLFNELLELFTVSKKLPNKAPAREAKKKAASASVRGGLRRSQSKEGAARPKESSAESRLLSFIDDGVFEEYWKLLIERLLASKDSLLVKALRSKYRSIRKDKLLESLGISEPRLKEVMESVTDIRLDKEGEFVLFEKENTGEYKEMAERISAFSEIAEDVLEGKWFEEIEKKDKEEERVGAEKEGGGWEEEEGEEETSSGEEVDETGLGDGYDDDFESYSSDYDSSDETEEE